MDSPSDRAPGPIPPVPPTAASVAGASDDERGTLEARLADHRPPEIPRVIAILRDVAAALDAAHRGGIVHGNIAPARVLIDAAGRATISNLGLPPSPQYRAPEQWRGEVIGPRTDQYALAVVAFQMLTGQPPFEGAETQDLMRLHLSAAVPRAATLRKGVTPAMDAALRRAMGKVPELRFSTASAFVDALSGDRPIAISLDSIEAIRHSEHPSAGGLGLAIGAVVVATLGIAAIAISAHRTPAVPPPRPPAQPPAPAVHDSAHPVPPTEATVPAPPVPPLASTTPLPAPESSPVPNGAPPDAVAPDLVVVPPSRPAPSTGAGAFIRVVVRGGVAAVRIDGRTYGFSPAIVSVEPGTHLVTVDGAGDAFLPSQRIVDAIAKDTTAAVFTPRIQHDAGVPDSNAAPLDTAQR